LQLRAQRVLLGTNVSNPVVKWLTLALVRFALRSPLVPMIQRRIFFGVPLPPLDREFSFRRPGTAREGSHAPN